MVSTPDFQGLKAIVRPHSLARLLLPPGMASALLVLASAPAFAVGTVLSGMFDGSETTTDPVVHSDGCANTPSGYRQSTFEVSVSGAYQFYDALSPLSYYWGFNGINVTTLVYEGSFSASNPGQNLMTSGGIDWGEVNLTAGTTYVLVVQLSCTSSEEGAWAVAFTGPGTVSSDQAVDVPAFTSGAFTENDPFIDSQIFFNGFGGGSGHYRQSGPIQVSRDGTYYFSSPFKGSLCLLVYTAPINPDDLWANLLTAQEANGPVELAAGQGYYFVAQECHGDGNGDYLGTHDYLYVLAPPAPFRINHGLADSWYNPETPGQGFLLDVFEQRNEVFLGWFTYLTDPPAGDEFGHLWMTAFGPFTSMSADLAIEWTGGGAFDAAQPQPYQYVQGSILLEFNDCTSGQVTWSIPSDIGGPAASGVIPIQRNANDAVALCESLYAGPGMPGPL